MGDQIYTNDAAAMATVVLYCNQRHDPCWVTHIAPEVAHLPYPGVSVRLLSIDVTADTAVIESGQTPITVPVSELRMTLCTTSPRMRISHGYID